MRADATESKEDRLNVLVTGGTGFVGRHLVSVLQENGFSVRVACRAAERELTVPSVSVGSIGSRTDWNTALEGVEAVVHLAARVHVMGEGAMDRNAFHEVNTAATIRLARAAVGAGIRRFVFLSTVKVNGESTNERPFSVHDVPHPQGEYAVSKLDAEIGLSKVAGLDRVIVRSPLVHGAGAKGNLERMCRLALAGVPVPFGGIHNRRDLVGVRNLAELLVRCISHPSAVGRTFMASDGEAISTPKLFRLIADAMGRRARIVSVPVGLVRAVGRVAGLSEEVSRLTDSLEIDIKETRNLLGWSPRVSIEEGIAEMARAMTRARP